MRAKKRNELNFHFFCSHSNFRAISRTETLASPAMSELYPPTAKRYIYTEAMPWPCWWLVSIFFFYLQKRLCHSLPRKRFLGEAFFLPPGNDGACTPNPLPLRNVTFSFCRCQKGRIIKHFNLQIFYVSVLIYHYEPAWNTTISRYKTLPLSFKDL